MKIFLLPIFLLSCYYCNCQKWFSPEQEWINSFCDPYSLVLSYTITHFEKDSNINNIIYKKLNRSHVQLNASFDTIRTDLLFILAREDDDKVYYWNNNEEYLVYDFSMSPGDSIRWFDSDGSEFCDYFFHLDSLIEVTLEGKPIRIQEGYYEGYFDKQYVRIYEGAGILEMKSVITGDWFVVGEIIPNLLVHCLEDCGSNLLCQYSDEQITIRSNERDCTKLTNDLATWFKPIDKWKLSYGYFTSSVISHKIFRYDKDTVINNKPFVKLSNTNIHLQGENDSIMVPGKPHYMLQDKEKVFYLNGDSTCMIYDFGMEKGDTL